MADDASKAQASEKCWVVVDKRKEEIETWTTREKAEASIQGSGGPIDQIFLYHTPVSELKNAFPNRPVVGGDLDAATRNKYIRKGWDPGTK